MSKKKITIKSFESLKQKDEQVNEDITSFDTKSDEYKVRAEKNKIDADDRQKNAAILDNFVEKYLKQMREGSSLKSSAVLRKEIQRLEKHIRVVIQAFYATDDKERIKLFKEYRGGGLSEDRE